MTTIIPKQKPAPIWLWGLWVIGFGLLSAYFPRDISYDIAHYHIHNGWSALNGRANIDLAPAEMHSFFNPAWQIFIWLLIDHLPGKTVAFLLGLLHAIGLPILYMLSKRLFKACNITASGVIILIIAIAGFTAEVSLTMISSIRNDMVSSNFFLLALALLLGPDGKGPTVKSVAWATFIVGAITGMKLANFIYIPGLAVFIILLGRNFSESVRNSLVSACCGFLGIVLVGGPWAWHLYQQMGNPFFPMLNGYFHAPLGPDGNFIDTRYLPHGLVDGLLRPWQFLFNGTLINEYDSRDPRFQLTYLGSFLILALAIYRALFKKQAIPRAALATALSLLVLIFVWTFMFSIKRYLSTAWLLGPVITALIIGLIWPKSLTNTKAPILAIAGLVALVFTTKLDTIRRVGWTAAGEKYIEITLPQEFDFENALIIYSGGWPSAFMATAFPASAVHTHAAAQSWSKVALDHYRPLIRKSVYEHRNKLYVVLLEPEEKDENYIENTLKQVKAELGVSVNLQDCRAPTTNIDDTINWLICPAKLKTNS